MLESSGISIEDVHARLEAVMNKIDLWKAKKFKKVPAQEVVRDAEFLLFVIQVLSVANAELKRTLLEKEAPLVDLAGQPLSGELREAKPLIEVVS